MEHFGGLYRVRKTSGVAVKCTLLNWYIYGKKQKVQGSLQCTASGKDLFCLGTTSSIEAKIRVISSQFI